MSLFGRRVVGRRFELAIFSKIRNRSPIVIPIAEAEGEPMTEVNWTPLPVPWAVRAADRIPKQRYYDEEFYALESELLWPRVWQMACRLEEIPSRGDFVEYEILDQSVIVVRLDEDTVRAFCRDQIAHYKVPRYIRMVTEFPTTVTGKVQKFQMRQQMIEELGLSLQGTA